MTAEPPRLMFPAVESGKWIQVVASEGLGDDTRTLEFSSYEEAALAAAAGGFEICPTTAAGMDRLWAWWLRDMEEAGCGGAAP